MILNKSKPGFLSGKIKTFGLQLLALSLFSCNKSTTNYADESFVGLTHVAYGVGPISMTIAGAPLFSAPLSFGNTTGIDGNPYDTTISKVSEMNIFLAQDTSMSIHGNTAFQRGNHYSIFFFDTLNRGPVSLIILQDNPPIIYDTFTTIRFMNFSPGTSFGLKFIYTKDYFVNDTFPISVRDTINTPLSPFVGYDPNPSIYTFSQYVHIGVNQVFAYTDSANPRVDLINPNLDSANFIKLDSLQFDSLKNYNIYLQGFRDSAGSSQNKFQIKSVRVN